MANKREVTERDLRMPEFRHLNAEDLDDYEFRSDGKIVRKDRWENAIRSIRSALGDHRCEFEIDDVVDAVRAIVAAHPDGAAFQDVVRLNWLEDHPEVENVTEHDEDGPITKLFRRGGAINDSEYTEIAQGYSLREAIDKAMEASRGGD